MAIDWGSIVSSVGAASTAIMGMGQSSKLNRLNAQNSYSLALAQQDIMSEKTKAEIDLKKQQNVIISFALIAVVILFAIYTFKK